MWWKNNAPREDSFTISANGPLLFVTKRKKRSPSAIHHLRDGSSLIVMRYRTFHEYLQAFVESRAGSSAKWPTHASREAH
jgi:hypothetical protein